MCWSCSCLTGIKRNLSCWIDYRCGLSKDRQTEFRQTTSRIWSIFKWTGNSMSKAYGIEFVGFETYNLRKNTHTHTHTGKHRRIDENSQRQNRKSRCEFDRSSPTYPYFEIQQLHEHFRTKNNLAKGASGVVNWNCFAICLEAEGGGDGAVGGGGDDDDGGGLSCKAGSSSWSIQ